MRFNTVAKRRIKTVLIAICIVFAFAALCMTVSRVFVKKDEQSTNRLVTSKVNTDILFIGTSQIAHAVNPLELWKHFGYTSHICSANHKGIRRDLAMLRLALAYTTPKVVFLSPDRYWRERGKEIQLLGYHMFSDCFPLSYAKIATTAELYEDLSDRLRILFPFYEYHPRWKELEEQDFADDFQFGFLRGAAFQTSKEILEPYASVDENDRELADCEEGKVLIEIIEECQRRGIEIVLLTLPQAVDAEDQRFYNGLQDLADQYGISYVNLLNRFDLVNTRIDFYDEEHVNISGARKLTSFLGNYIAQNYDVPCRFDSPEYMEEWGADYQRYVSFKYDKLRATDELDKLLLQLHDDTVNVAIFVKGGSACLKEPQTVNLLRNVIPMEKLDAARDADKSYLAVTDYNTGAIKEYIDPDSNTVNNYEMPADGDLCIAAFDRWTGERICTKSFRIYSSYKAECIDQED